MGTVVRRRSCEQASAYVYLIDKGTADQAIDHVFWIDLPEERSTVLRSYFMTPPYGRSSSASSSSRGVFPLPDSHSHIAFMEQYWTTLILKTQAEAGGANLDCMLRVTGNATVVLVQMGNVGI